MTPVPDWFSALGHNHGLANVVAFIANYGIFLSAMALVGAGWLHRNRPTLLIPFLVGALIATVLDLLAARTFFEVRPFVALHAAPLVPHDPGDNAFPSDHAVSSAYVASFLYFVDVRWAMLATAVALMVGLARITALLHWPQDVLVGWLIGSWSGTLAGLLTPRSDTRAK